MLRSQSTRRPDDVAREQFYGADAVAAATAPKHSQLVFSYANPSALKQARMEALQIKMQARLQANLPPPPINPYEGLETSDPSTALVRSMHTLLALQQRAAAATAQQP